jgi:predicted metal-dependent phosphoesterase TrpH
MLKVELHAHTADDPVDRIPHTSRELIDRAAALGYAALAITLHDRQLEIGDLAPYAAGRGIVLIRGIEQTIEGKHVLLLNFSSATGQVRSFEDVARLKQREPSGLVIAPHPFFPIPNALGPLLTRHADLFDAVEWHGMFTTMVNFNPPAKRWATRYGKPLVGSGAVHRLHQLGSCYSLVDAGPDPDAICDAVREGRVQVAVKPISFQSAVRTAVDMLASDARARFESKFDVRSRMSNQVLPRAHEVKTTLPARPGRHFKNPLAP